MEINTLRQTFNLFWGEDLQAEMGEPRPEFCGFGAVEEAAFVTAKTHNQFNAVQSVWDIADMGDVLTVDDAIANLEEFHDGCPLVAEDILYGYNPQR